MKAKADWSLLIAAATSKVKVFKWEIKGIDLLMLLLIVAGYDQLVDSFGAAYYTSYLKAAGIEGGVIVLSRMYSRFQKDYMKTALYALLVLSFYANTTSEWIKVTGTQYLTDETFAALGWYQGIRGVMVAGFIPYIIWILTKTRIECLHEIVALESNIVDMVKAQTKADAVREQGRRTRLRAKLKKLGVDVDELETMEEIEAAAVQAGIIPALA